MFACIKFVKQTVLKTGQIGLTLNEIELGIGIRKLQMKKEYRLTVGTPVL